MPLVDTHTHLNDEAFADDLEEVLDRAGEAGVGRLVVAGYDLPSSQAAVTIAERYPEVWATVGVSPHEAMAWSAASAERLAGLTGSGKVVAVGEIGLDYHYDLSPRETQRAVFCAQIELAVALDLPIVVHSREAHADTLAALRAHDARAVGGVMHCFSGSLETALAAWSLGFHISFAGPLTFANAARLREVAGRVPRAALLTETDAPYLTPHPHRGRRNEPAMVALVAAALAEARGMQIEELTAVVWENAERVFGFTRPNRAREGGRPGAGRLRT